VNVALLVYVAGALVALWRTDALWPTRITLALLWPVGPVAFLLTVSLLLVVSVFVFPVVGALVAAAALGWWWVAG
jgi:hypothetical protein